MFNGKEVSVGRPPAMPKIGKVVLRPEGEMDFANLFVRKMYEKVCERDARFE
jgi:hypothetical protein